MKFIIGASGSGKTTYAYKKIIERSLKEKNTEYIILVPEQYTMQAQKDIAGLHPYHASLNIDATSFNRLAYRIFKELGIKCPDLLDDTAKAVIIRKLSLEYKSRLGIWKNQFSKPGFIDEMKSMISELYQYGISADDIINIKNNSYKNQTDGVQAFLKSGRILKQKLDDLEVIYNAFCEFTKRKYMTAEEIPAILYENIHKSDIIKNSYILLDGFTGFTPVQYKIIDRLLDCSKGLECTVSIGSGDEKYYEFSETELFAMGKTMINKINESAKSKNIKTEIYDLNKNYKNTQLRPRFKEAPEIDFLERHFLRYDHVKSVYSGKNIRLIRAANTQEEVNAVCCTIMRLIKNENMRYRDIAVITADVTLYSGKFKKYFELNSIPYFIDGNIGIEDNNLVEFIRAAFLLMSSNYSYDAVMRYIKSGFVCSSTRLESLMDNYMTACGIRGYKRIKKQWDYVPYSLEGMDIDELNEFKDGIFNKLEGFHKAWHKKKTDAALILDSFILLMEELDIRAKIIALSNFFEAENLPEKAREYAEVYDATEEFFDKIKRLLKDEEIKKNELLEIINAGLGEIKVGIIPAKVDRITVGDIKRSRLKDIKALFIVGADDNMMPDIKKTQSIFNDREKENLKKLGIELSSTAKEDLFVQRFYMYMNITKPSKYLYISYSAMDADSRPVRESSFSAAVKNMYRGLKTEEASKFTGVYSIYTAKQRFIVLIDMLKRNQFSIGDNSECDIEFKKLSELFNWSKLKEASLYTYDDTAAENRLDTSAAINIYSRIINTDYVIKNNEFESGNISKNNAAESNEANKNIISSITRLEKYISCPYAFFMRYGLGIAKRQIYSLEAVDIGTLVHKTIELAFLSCKRNSQDIALISEDERNRLVEICAKQALGENLSGIYNESARNEYLVQRLIRMAKQSVGVLSYQLNQGDFIPCEFEKKFGRYDKIKALELNLNCKATGAGSACKDSENVNMFLEGKIDRVDICDEGDRIFAKIIDYKTGSMSWEPDLVYYGSQMQLVIYLEALKEMLMKKFPHKEVLPAAMLYFHIDDPLIEAVPYADDDEVKNALIRELRPSGLVNSDIDIIKRLDKNIEGSSLVIPASIKNNTVQAYRSSTASTERFSKLGEYVKNKCTDIGNDMLSGRISVNPSLRGNISACDYCEYRAVCGFDKKTPGYNYRVFKKLGPDEVWHNIEKDKYNGGKLD